MRETKTTEEDIGLLKANGYTQLTEEYTPEEEEMMARAVAQLEKNSRSYIIVEGESGKSIWTKTRFTLTERAGEDGQ